MRTLLAVLLLFIVTALQAQTKKINAGGIEIEASPLDTSMDYEFDMVGIMPVFPGGVEQLIEFAKSKIKYPETAINNNIQGTVTLSFIIDKRGRVINRCVYKGVRKDLDTVCLKMPNEMPMWKPGKVNGRPIAIKERWKIIFKLTD